MKLQKFLIRQSFRMLNMITFNVNSLRGNAINRVAHILGTLKPAPDAVFLQEVSAKSTTKLATLLHYDHFWTRSSFLGNALLAKRQILHKKRIELSLGDKCEMRSAIKACIQNKYGHIITVAGTHLDHLSEDYRLHQLNILAEHLADVEVLAGDFNALNFSDYTTDEMDKINTRRLTAGLECARNDLMSQVRELGFIIPEFAGPTSKVDTRVDYICHRHTHTCTCHEVHHMIKHGYSDHNIVQFTSQMSW